MNARLPGLVLLTVTAASPTSATPPLAEFRWLEEPAFLSPEVLGMSADGNVVLRDSGWLVIYGQGRVSLGPYTIGGRLDSLRLSRNGQYVAARRIATPPAAHGPYAIWTRGGGWRVLSGVGIDSNSSSFALSDTGVVAAAAGAALQWTSDVGTRLPLPAGHDAAVPVAITPNGRWIVGMSGRLGFAGVWPIRWTDASSPESPAAGGPDYLFGARVSDDGGTVWCVTAHFAPAGFSIVRWRPGIGTETIDPPQGGDWEPSFEASADGRAFVSTALIGGRYHAVLWRDGEGVQILPTPGGEAVDQFGVLLSADGATVIGHLGVARERCFIWNAAHGSRDLASVLVSSAGDPVTRTNLHPGFLSADGRTIAGNADFLHGWLARFDPICSADLDNSYTVEMHDIFWYLEQYFADTALADWDRSGSVNAEDLFAYLSDWFGPCP